jgi:hypothetical protein
VTAFGRFVIWASGAFLLAGILLPGVAEILLRLYLFTLAGGFVAIRAWDADLPSRATLDAYSPFTDEGAARPPPEAPPAIRRRASLLRATDDPGRAGRTPVPVSVKWAVLDEASHRLAEGRGLDLNDPDHHARIRSLVSEETWRLVRPPGSDEVAGSLLHPDDPPVTLDRLPSILDDLERL